MRQARPELKKITKGVLIATLASVLTSGFLNAESQALGMQNFVNQMFIASSGATTAASGNGVTYSGGYFEARTPLSGANVIAFSPPDISAGCGGINLFFGSFHFINGQEFMALLREIGQQALGYAFQLAIDAMCHQCGALLSMIEKDIQDMNNALKNTCQLAKGIFSGADMGNIAQVVNETRKVMSSAVGDVSGIFTGTEPYMQSTISSDEASIKTNYTELVNSVGLNGQTTQQQKQITVPQAASAPQFNMFWKSINITQTQNLLNGLGMAGGLSPAVPEAQSPTTNINCENAAVANACTKEILMSVAGTLVIPPLESNNDTNAGSQAMQQQTNNTATGNIGGKAAWYQPQLSLIDLVNGTPNAQVYQCNYDAIGGTTYTQYGPNTGCIGPMQTTTLQAMGYVGIKAAVKDLMFGGLLNGVNHNGLINDLEQGAPLSATAQAFENGLPPGTQLLLKNAQTGNQNNASNLLRQVGIMIEPEVVDEFAAKYGEAVLKAVQPYSDVKHIILEPGYQQNLRTLQSEENLYVKLESDNMKLTRLATTIVHNARKAMATGEIEGG